ncbi:ParB/RepB/Spo0J family partition protein [Myxococcus llanfairpwllgwyngyllgogerychwyrndrobwllllantysiliogogogochensis]|uniref:ParB/RepB/Spo0J family partition protein n=1 Tax=Myxococcus llanfairpwllgwyngyllgogerychwyrndrobwllllantysiliogogogochensis TaxID=2590453 RepID=A0A540WI34_9BACT|nr:ParB/RepB/Spo0J family partition protein [Myxococcus llanfairpwllgwyngyllgogerychwyrndrobwllllantysiliogogogochensis]TQF08668.1 ParB/RepB/Spo0J family partition protein [Myxococcus llanfairpwllgwyngyllgogerychwyrndrobwllllantysiliogogogochensis]
MAMSEQGQTTMRVVMMPLGNLVEGDNYRKSIEEGPLAELAASIKARGVEVPILVRPADGRPFEDGSPIEDRAFKVTAGFRRFRASHWAGLTHVPVIIREMSDDLAQEANLVENLFRVDPHPLDESDAFAAFLGRGHTADTIAGVTGKDRRHVVRRLQLQKLGKPARKAFKDGKILSDVATMIATITDLDAQNEATEALTRLADPEGVNAARHFIDRNFRLRLKDAPFATNRDDLGPGLPACNACPRRTGATPDLFGEASDKDLCTDRKCFTQKAEAGWTEKCEEALAKGLEVLDESESKKLFQDGNYLAYGCGYVDLGAQCYRDAQKRTWGAVLGKVRPNVILARDSFGRAHQLCREEDVRAALVYLHGDAEKPPAQTEGEEPKAKRREERTRALRSREIINRGLAAVADAGEKVNPSGGVEIWRHLAGEAVELASYLNWACVGKVRGIEGKPYEVKHQLLARLEAMTGAQAFGLLCQILSSRWASAPSLEKLPPSLDGTAKVLNVDLEALAKSVDAESTEKARLKAEGAECPRCSKRSKRFVLLPNKERICHVCSRTQMDEQAPIQKAA